MTPAMRRMLMQNSREAERKRRDGEDERNHERTPRRYEPTEDVRSGNGYPRYDGGDYEPMNYGGRRRNSKGQYTRMAYYPDNGEEDYPSMRHNPTRYVPPIYEGDGRRERTDGRPVNKIGFSIGGEMERLPSEIRHNGRSDAGYQPMTEYGYRGSAEKMSGYGEGTGYIPFTKQMALEWTEGMENEDGTHGAHWSLEQAKQVMAQRGIECDPLEFWVALNMMYSDYSMVAKKLNVNTIEFYACMAKAFLDDKDAVDDKLAAYYEYIVK